MIRIIMVVVIVICLVVVNIFVMFVYGWLVNYGKILIVDLFWLFDVSKFIVYRWLFLS